MNFQHTRMQTRPIAARFAGLFMAAVAALTVSLTCAAPSAFASTYSQQNTSLASCFAKHHIEIAESFDFAVSAPSALNKEITVHVQGHAFNGAQIDTAISVEPGKSGKMKCDPGLYTFAVDAADASNDEIVCKAASKAYVFLGQAGAKVMLAIEKDDQATQAMLDAKKAEEERLAAEAKAAEEKAAAEQAAAEQAAAEQASRQAVSQQAAQNNTATVYVTKSGECYHRDGCSSLKKSKIPMSQSEAEAKGYRPCKNCKP